MFMASLNSTVIAPAMGKISSQLNDIEDATWIATAYLVAFNATQPLYGKFSDIFGRKLVIQVAIFLFFVGSIVNALATSMGMLIAGRTVQGLGGGGVISICYIIIADISPVDMRPRYQALMMVIYGVASVVGPLIGGAFVDHVSWRWDFWLNVILSVVAFTIITVFLKIPVEGSSSFRDKFKRIDWLGIAFSILFVVLLLLALSWGGVKYAWNSPHVIACFVASGVSFILLIFIEGWVAKEPLIPFPVILNPAVAIIYIFTFFVAFGFIGTLYFGPVIFQSVYGADSTTSGLRLLPYMVCMIAASIGSGFFIPIVKRVKPFIVAGAALNLLGYGLFYTLNPSSNYGMQTGYLSFAGLGFGFTMQNTIVAVQNSTEKKYLAVATSLNSFFMTLASAIGIAVYQTAMNVIIAGELQSADPAAVQAAESIGAIANYTAIGLLPEQFRKIIIDVFSVTLHKVFIIPLVTAAAALIISLFIKNDRFGGPVAKETINVNEPAANTEHKEEVLDEEKAIASNEA
ncbi:major facilitator superfamily domain-containing protein [Umbelopsis sp. AD052]|nr:major facilitator superfamily domain-containing protein [Umbelopsis sp. AD052]